MLTKKAGQSVVGETRWNTICPKHSLVGTDRCHGEKRRSDAIGHKYVGLSNVRPPMSVFLNIFNLPRAKALLNSNILTLTINPSHSVCGRSSGKLTRRRLLLTGVGLVGLRNLLVGEPAT